MTTKASKPITTPGGKLSEGDVIHFRTSLTAFGFVRGRGESLTLTAEMIAGSIDRTGRSWLDQVDDEDARFGHGSWPDGEPRWAYGDPTWEFQREAARKLAWSHQDPVIRAQAMREVDLIFGPALPTSQTTNSARDPSIAIAEDQERARRLAGLRQVSSYSPIERTV